MSLKQLSQQALHCFKNTHSAIRQKNAAFSRVAMKIRPNASTVLANSAIFYSFQDAVNDALSGEPALFEDACLPSRDCREAWTDVDQIFDHADTLQNCLAFPMVSDALRAHNLSVVDTAYCTEMGVVGDADIANRVSDTLLTCVDSYLTHDRYESRPETNRSVGDDQLHSFCDWLQPKKLNTEIRRIGVG